MTRDEAIHAAVEAGMTCYGAKSEKLGHSWHSYTDSIERFANLVAAREREECAGICDRFYEREMNPAECASAIRLRKP